LPIEKAYRLANFLSTPHGRLGTEDDMMRVLRDYALSTPHGRLGTFKIEEDIEEVEDLSTPHGRLGTRR